MTFKQLLVSIDSIKVQNYYIYRAYIVNQSAGGLVKGSNLLAVQNITDLNFARKIVNGKLLNYTDKIIFIDI